MIMTKTSAVDAADILIDARRSNTQLPTLPDRLQPTVLGQAYAIQDATLALLGPVGGWKVGAKSDSEPRCSVLPKSAFLDDVKPLDWLPGGYQVEVELGFVVKSSLPARAVPYTEDEVNAAIGAGHLAIELVASRFIDRKSLSPLMAIADLQSNAGVFCSAPVTDWRDRNLADIAITLSINGNLLSQPPKNTGWPDTLVTLTWLANHAAARGQALSAGQIIITGARIGPVPVAPGDEIVASAPGFEEVPLQFKDQ